MDITCNLEISIDSKKSTKKSKHKVKKHNAPSTSRPKKKSNGKSKKNKKVKQTKKEDFVSSTESEKESLSNDEEENHFCQKGVLTDRMFIGCEGGLLVEYCVKKREIIKKYENFMQSDIKAMVYTHDKKNLYVTDFSGHLKVFDVEQEEVSKDYGKVCEFMITICLTKDDQYFFTGDYTTGTQLQWSTSTQKIHKDYQKVLKDKVKRLPHEWDNMDLIENRFLCKLNCKDPITKGISKVYVTNNNRYLFVGCVNGFLAQFNVKKQKKIKNYGYIVPNFIYDMVSTKNGEELYVADYEGYQVKISTKSKSILQDFGQIGEKYTHCILIREPDNKFYMQSVKICTLDNLKMIKCHNQLYSKHIRSMIFYNTNRAILTCGLDGEFKQWNSDNMEVTYAKPITEKKIWVMVL